MTRAIEFMAYQAARDSLEQRLTQANARLRAIPGIGSGQCGLTPDSVKFGSEYREARACYEHFHRVLGALNRHNLKRFAPELRAERDARRAAKLASMAESEGPISI